MLCECVRARKAGVACAGSSPREKSLHRILEMEGTWGRTCPVIDTHGQGELAL